MRKRFLTILVAKWLGSFILVLAFQCVSGQSLENLGKQEPFKIRGSIGASANYYSSNEAVASRPPWSWNLYGSLTPQVYGVSLPVSFTLNQFGNSFSQPFAQFGISPTYKWAKIHLGFRNIRMSPLVFDGQSFRGAGVELNPGLLRFAAFYGRLNKKVNEDTTSGQFAVPQFSRTGYGVKLGVGNQNHYLDLIYFYAKDDSTSATVINKQKIQAQENAVIGTSLKTTILKKVVLMADLAASGLTSDLSSEKLDSVTGGLINKVFSNLLPFRNSTDVHFGGQASVSASLQNFNTTIGYRRVDPGFKSLGTPYMLNDVEMINWATNSNLLDGKVNINTNISNQRNNLKRDLTSRLNTSVGNLNVSAMVSQKMHINFGYSGYILKQSDGTLQLTDSTRLNQQIHQLNLMPSYTIFNNTRSQSFSASLNYMKLNDMNPVTSPSTSSSNLSTSLNYSLGFTKMGVNINSGVLYNQYV
ncbi:MAG: hypothetical protein M9898_05660 [Chitinophagaceae bacterium]|nr:hypothetical protein [Chitinophagaceae bacterium]